MSGVELNNNLGGCSFEQEGSDFYIVGADAVRKKLGSIISSVALISSDSQTNPTLAVATYTAEGDGECVICIAGSSPQLKTDGNVLLNTGSFAAGGAHTMILSVILLNKNQSVIVKGWSNARIYKCS